MNAIGAASNALLTIASHVAKISTDKTPGVSLRRFAFVMFSFDFALVLVLASFVLAFALAFVVLALAFTLVSFVLAFAFSLVSFASLAMLMSTCVANVHGRNTILRTCGPCGVAVYDKHQ